MVKQHIINNFKTKISWEFLMTSRKKYFVQWALFASNKRPGISFRWSLVALYKWSLYREKFDLKTWGKITIWLLRTGGWFKKVVLKIGLTVHTYNSIFIISWMLCPDHDIAGYVQLVIIKREAKVQVCSTKACNTKFFVLLNMLLKVVI